MYKKEKLIDSFYLYASLLHVHCCLYSTNIHVYTYIFLCESKFYFLEQKIYNSVINRYNNIVMV